MLACCTQASHTITWTGKTHTYSSTHTMELEEHRTSRNYFCTYLYLYLLILIKIAGFDCRIHGFSDYNPALAAFWQESGDPI